MERKIMAALIRIKAIVDEGIEDDSFADEEMRIRETEARWEKFKAKDAVGIGWPEIDMTRLKGVSLEAVKNELQKCYPEDNGMTRGNSASIIYMFVNCLEEGCFVVSPYGANDEINIGVIASELRYGKELGSDEYVNVRSVKWLSSIPRSRLSLELRTALKNRRTLGDLTKFRAEIGALAEGKDYRPIKPKLEKINLPESVEFSFPLRPDFLALLKLPRNLNRKDVERISRFLETLIYD